jgi:hypothetical protein
MAIGALFTLFVLPSVYVLIAKDHSHNRAAAPAPATPPEFAPTGTLDKQPV